jgi:cytoplasmic iron level regulating protein YaaA (DUF328/UPF0246 family)
MIILGSSKGQQHLPADAHLATTLPEFLPQAEQLLHQLRSLSSDELADLMHLSVPLAERTRAQFQSLNVKNLPVTGSPALLTFSGVVFQGIDARNCNSADLVFAQQHLRILSGLYGILRPLDRIMPYRLEMGTPLANERGTTLYAYWSELVTEHLNRALAGEQHPMLINLASSEYAKTVLQTRLQAPWLDIQFKEETEGRLKTVAVYSKQARGLMAGFALRERIVQPDDLKGFTGNGYRFRPDLSTERLWLFSRPLP